MKKLYSTASLLLIFAVSGAFAAGIPPEKVTRPAGSEAFQGDRAELVAKGETLWNDKSLSGKGKKACSSCHKGATKMFKDSFQADYPHAVKMAKKKSKIEQVDAEQMVQFCMIAAMKNDDVLAWDSEELAALTAYTEDVIQPNYVKAKSE